MANENGFKISTARIVRWSVVVAAVGILLAGANNALEYIGGPPPFASAASVEEVQIKVGENRLLILDTQYARLLAAQRDFMLADRIVPQSLIEQIRDKCREIRTAGGSC